jgi:hypothetical protein
VSIASTCLASQGTIIDNKGQDKFLERLLEKCYENKT